MPWKESSVMEERLRFVARLLEEVSRGTNIPAGSCSCRKTAPTTALKTWQEYDGKC